MTQWPCRPALESVTPHSEVAVSCFCQPWGCQKVRWQPAEGRWTSAVPESRPSAGCGDTAVCEVGSSETLRGKKKMNPLSHSLFSYPWRVQHITKNINDGGKLFGCFIVIELKQTTIVRALMKMLNQTFLFLINVLQLQPTLLVSTDHFISKD